MGSQEEKPGETGVPEAEFADQVQLGEDVESMVVKQVEFYLSWGNLQTDYYLKSMMNTDHWVELKVLADFPRLKGLGVSDVHSLGKTLKERSTSLQVNDEKLEVRPLYLANERKRSVLILREIPSSTPEEEIRELFEGVEECPPIHSVKPDVAETWFVTFDTEDGAVIAHELTKKLSFMGQPVKARVKNSLRANPSGFMDPIAVGLNEMSSPPPPPPPYFQSPPPFFQRSYGPAYTEIPPSIQNPYSRRPSRSISGGHPNQHQRSSSAGARGGATANADRTQSAQVANRGGINQSRTVRSNPTKSNRVKPKRKSPNEGGDMRVTSTESERQKSDVNLSSTNFPPLGGDETVKKEPKDVSEETSNSSSEKNLPDAAANSDEDKRISRSSSESGANGSAKTYASIVLIAKSPKPQTISQPKASSAPSTPAASLPSLIETEETKPEVKQERPVANEKEEQPSLVETTVNSSSVPTKKPSKSGAQDRQGSPPEEPGKAKTLSVWSNLPKSVLEAPGKTPPAAKSQTSSLQ